MPARLATSSDSATVTLAARRSAPAPARRSTASRRSALYLRAVIVRWGGGVEEGSGAESAGRRGGEVPQIDPKADPKHCQTAHNLGAQPAPHR